jgi:hypothetical protein
MVRGQIMWCHVGWCVPVGRYILLEDDAILMFGKYEGERISQLDEIDNSYIGWLRYHLPRCFEDLKKVLRRYDDGSYLQGEEARRDREEVWAWSFGGYPSLDDEDYDDPEDDPFYGLDMDDCNF